MADKKEKESDENMSFLDHLEDLRWHLVRSFTCILVFAIAAFIFKDIIFDKIILAPKHPGFFTNRMLCKLGDIMNAPALCINSEPLNIINIKMSGQFTTHIMISLVAGFILGFPYVIFELMRFVTPALYKNEQKYASGGIFYTSSLFFAGVLFGYYVIIPLSIQFLGTYSVSEEVTNQINLKSYISILTSVALAGGIIFELPVLIYFLSKIGLVTPQFLRKYRKHSIIVILVLSAIITPPDIFSQVLVCLPLLVLYEAGIVISKRIMRKNELEG